MRDGEEETHAIKLQQEKRGKEGGGRKMERGGEEEGVESGRVQMVSNLLGTNSFATAALFVRIKLWIESYTSAPCATTSLYTVCHNWLAHCHND